MKTYKHNRLSYIAKENENQSYEIMLEGEDMPIILLKELIENSLDRTLQPKENDSLLEELSDLEHKQRINRAKSISEEESISLKRRKRWLKCFCDYSELPEDVKEYDREYARKVIETIKKHTTKIDIAKIIDDILYQADVDYISKRGKEDIITKLKEKGLYKE